MQGGPGCTSGVVRSLASDNDIVSGNTIVIDTTDQLKDSDVSSVALASTHAHPVETASERTLLGCFGLSSIPSVSHQMTLSCSPSSLLPLSLPLSLPRSSPLSLATSLPLPRSPSPSISLARAHITASVEYSSFTHDSGNACGRSDVINIRRTSAYIPHARMMKIVGPTRRTRMRMPQDHATPRRATHVGWWTGVHLQVNLPWNRRPLPGCCRRRRSKATPRIVLQNASDVRDHVRG